MPANGGATVTLLADLGPCYPAGVVPLRDDRVVMGRTIDAATPEDNGFELAVADADGSGQAVYGCVDPGGLIDVSDDGALALIGFAPGGDWLHIAVRVVRLADGVTVAELVDEGQNLTPVGFDPRDSSRVLLGHERADFITPAVWDTVTGERTDITTSLEGDVMAKWYPRGDALLLKVLRRARHALYRYDMSTGALAQIPAPDGSIRGTRTKGLTSTDVPEAKAQRDPRNS